MKKNKSLIDKKDKKKEGGSNNPRDFINIELLENYYLGLIHKNGYNKCLVSVELTEKLMLLEIYKALCLRDNGINNNANNTYRDSDY